MVGGAAVLLVVAGMIEGFVSAERRRARRPLAASGASLVFLGVYLAERTAEPV